MPRVSIVIPCFNKGEFIDQAVNSVLNQTYRDIELVIVNDGSDDGHTEKKLEDYHQSGVKVIHTANYGVSEARNTGIRESRGEYILPLDADDEIEKDYVRHAVDILDSRQEVGIVYCLAKFFDKRNQEWELPPYSREAILLDNMIFCSAFFRRSDWEKVKGYNPNMRNGYEDWDFWLSLIELGLDVYRIPQTLFLYRIGDAAARHFMTEEKEIDMNMRRQLVANHKTLYNSAMTGRETNRLYTAILRGYLKGLENERWALVRFMRMANATMAKASFNKLSCREES